jgi:hypothetical protein
MNLGIKCILSDHFYLNQVKKWALNKELNSPWCLY